MYHLSPPLSPTDEEENFGYRLFDPILMQMWLFKLRSKFAEETGCEDDRLHRAVSQKAVSFVPTAARTWNLTSINVCKRKAVPLHAMEALGGEEYSSYSFTTSALDGGEWSASRPGRSLPPAKEPPIPIVQEAGWAPDDRGKILCPYRGSNPGRPARSQTLCICIGLIPFYPSFFKN
jgi:hypothetical protein